MGVILYSLFSLNVPYAGTDSETIRRQIDENELVFKQPIWQHVSDDCKHLIGLMLEKDQVARIDIRGVLSHAWVRGGAGERP